MSLQYTIVLRREPDGSAVNVHVPALPGVFTWGANEEEAIASAREAIALHLEGFRERGLPLPANRVSRFKKHGYPRATPRSLSRRTQHHIRKPFSRASNAIRTIQIAPLLSGSRDADEPRIA
jgi:predicted RNase H-like HicB family nuclease